MSLFKRGYNAVEEEKKRQEENRQSGNRLWRFFIQGDGSEADVRFLTEEPLNYYEHTLKVIQNGKERYDSAVCIGDDCPICARGERPTFKGAYLIVDKRPYEYTDKDGNKKSGSDQVRLYVQGTRVLSQLDRISNKYGLSNRDVTIVRIGTGTATTYTIERGEKEDLTPDYIESLLPDSIKEQYNGTVDSLYDIVEEQLKLWIPEESRAIVEGEAPSNSNEEVDEEISDGEEETTSIKSKFKRK